MSGLTDDDLHLFNEGTHYQLHQRLGAHPGADGTRFARDADEMLAEGFGSD